MLIVRVINVMARKKGCCFRMVKYISILAQLAVLGAAGYAVPVDIETLKDLESKISLSEQQSMIGEILNIVTMYG